MKKHFLLLLIAVFMWNKAILAQTFSFEQSALATLKGKPNAWAGGLNSVQVSNFDLHNDTTPDLLVFDRYANHLHVFEGKRNADNSIGYLHSPQYETLFPKDIENWALWLDYDNDGEADLFTFAPQGIRVFRNTYKQNQKIGWEVVADPLYTIGFSGKLNLYVASSDIPALTDIDADGDIDVLTFDFSGNFVEFHKNFSIEETGKANAFIFRRQGYCWGDFYKEHCRDVRFNIDCQTGRITAKDSTANKNARLEHSGNSLLVSDLDGDGLKDALFGHITCQNLGFLSNGGSNQKLSFKQVAYAFPTANPIFFNIFPAIFKGNFDGQNTNLLASPNTYNNEGNLINFGASVWLYAQKGKEFELLKKDFLQDTMLDLGTNTSPAFADLDGDGDQDLLLGHGGYATETGYRAGIHVFTNVGSATQAIFEKGTTDFLDISAKLATEENILLTDLQPFVADMNADGSPDVGFVANTFKGIQIYYLPNKAPRGRAFVLNYADRKLLPTPANVRLGDNLLFVDADNDQDIDVLVGKTYGQIQFFKNVGTPQNPDYQLEKEILGKINEDYATRGMSMAIADMNADGKADLLTADATGSLTLYADVWNQPEKWKADTDFKWTIGQKLGANLLPALADLNADRLPDLVLGTSTGGLRLLKNTSKASAVPPMQNAIGTIYPNPTTGFLYVNNTTASRATLYDLLGQQLLEQTLNPAQENGLDLSYLPNGLYMLQLQGSQSSQVYKVLVGK